MRLSRTQTGTEQKAKRRLPGCPTAARHFITGQCPLTRDPGRIIRSAEEVCPFLGPTEAPGGEACHRARTGHRPLGPGAPRDATPSTSSPAGPLRGKKFEAWLCKLFKASASPGLFSHFGGPLEGPSRRPSRPSRLFPTYYSACRCLTCSPRVRSPRKLAVAAAPRVQPPPAPPLRPVGEN